MTNSNTSTFKGLLAKVPAFADLSEQHLEWLAGRARPFHCTVGQDLLLPDRLPEYCFCVVEGKGRLLHHDPGVRRPVTLALANPGDLVGWSGLVRRSPCEWVTASTPLKLIGITADDFYTLESQSESFRHWLSSKNSPSEFISGLTNALRQRPHAEPNEREVLRRLLPGMQSICSLPDRRLPDDGFIWLWNSQLLSGSPITIGDPVDPVRLSQIPASEPFRLLRIDPDLWNRELLHDKPGPADAKLATTTDLGITIVTLI